MNQLELWSQNKKNIRTDFRNLDRPLPDLLPRLSTYLVEVLEQS